MGQNRTKIQRCFRVHHRVNKKAEVSFAKQKEWYIEYQRKARERRNREKACAVKKAVHNKELITYLMATLSDLGLGYIINIGGQESDGGVRLVHNLNDGLNTCYSVHSVMLCEANKYGCHELFAESGELLMPGDGANNWLFAFAAELINRCPISPSDDSGEKHPLGRVANSYHVLVREPPTDEGGKFAEDKCALWLRNCGEHMDEDTTNFNGEMREADPDLLLKRYKNVFDRIRNSSAYDDGMRSVASLVWERLARPMM